MTTYSVKKAPTEEIVEYLLSQDIPELVFYYYPNLSEAT